MENVKPHLDYYKFFPDDRILFLSDLHGEVSEPIG